VTSKNSHRRISGAYSRAKRLDVDDTSKIVLMSDVHRGRGAGSDNFAKNQKLYYTALRHYDREGYTYIELGDGDDLWQERHMWEITAEYDHIFALLAKLYREGRFHMLYGNHDMIKRSGAWTQRNLYTYSPKPMGMPSPLFPNMVVEESILLTHRPRGGKMLLLHGHQADFFNCRLWWLSRFLVRYIWQPLELVGFQNPFDNERNPRRRSRVEQILTCWGEKMDIRVVAGHTHRPIFPQHDGERYMNDGSCVHTRYITALEIAEGKICLVKWEVAVKEDGILYITKEPISGTGRI